MNGVDMDVKRFLKRLGYRGEKSLSRVVKVGE
jgi:hypothetical protein